MFRKCAFEVLAPRFELMGKRVAGGDRGIHGRLKLLDLSQRGLVPHSLPCPSSDRAPQGPPTLAQQRSSDSRSAAPVVIALSRRATCSRVSSSSPRSRSKLPLEYLAGRSDALDGGMIRPAVRLPGDDHHRVGFGVHLLRWHGRSMSRWTSDHESLVAVIAPNLVTDVAAPHSQPRLATRARDGDPLHRVRRLRRWHEIVLGRVGDERPARFAGAENVLAVRAGAAWHPMSLAATFWLAVQRGQTAMNCHSVWFKGELSGNAIDVACGRDTTRLFESCVFDQSNVRVTVVQPPAKLAAL